MLEDEQDNPDDHRLAHELADQAASRLLTLQKESVASGRDRWDTEKDGDRSSHLWLIDKLAAARPNDTLFSEEGNDDLGRLKASRVWIIDPLDGSASFGVGTPEWAVHVALVIDGVAEVGAVGSPGVGEVVSTYRPSTPPSTEGRTPIIVTGRTRASNDGQWLAHALEGELVACSSAGFKSALVATGAADVYVHDSPLYEWDVAGPAAMAKASGLDVSGAAGEPLVFNKARPVVESLVITRPHLTEAVLASLSERRSG